MTTARHWLGWLGLLACVWAVVPPPAAGGDVTAVVRDQRDQPVEDVVVSAVPEGRPAALPATPVREVVDQINLEFVPHVKPIVAGSSVLFPNKDDVRHHVYSFSPAKRFELPLYSGTPAAPVVFDRPGIVTIGCNIHDWMLGYIYVAETPYLARTGADGRARLESLPAGRYVVRVWHPRMDGTEEATGRTVALDRTGAQDLAWSVTLKPLLRPRRAPVPGQRGYP
jgi:plastocyanin